MDELHGRLVWTTFTDLSGVPMYCPFFGRFFVQTALLALDESLDEQEMGLSSCFPISFRYLPQDKVSNLEVSLSDFGVVVLGHEILA